MGENLNMHEEVVAEPVEEMAAPALDTGEEPVAQNKAKGDKAGAWIKSLFSTKKRKIIAVVLLVVIVLGGAAVGVFFLFFTVFYGGAVLQSLLLRCAHIF